MVKVFSLGQVGYIFECGDTKWVIDPYLSDYVEDLYGEVFRRQVPVPVKPDSIRDLDFMLITHEHEDHFDPNSIKAILANNPYCKLICPVECNVLVKEKVGDYACTNLRMGEAVSFGEVVITGLPAAHAELEVKDGYSRWMGFLMQMPGLTLYHAGDTIPFEMIDQYLPTQIDYSFFPINEKNYFRDKAGIIGNMTCREAIEWARALNVTTMVPTHWDLFAGNSTDKEEFDLVAKKLEYNDYLWIDAGKSLELKSER